MAAARRARAPGAYRACAGVAGGLAHLRRQLPLSPRPRPRVRRLYRRPRLPGSAPAAVRGVPAVQESPERESAARGRGDRLGGCARRGGRRLAVDADAGDAGRDPHRRCGRDAELRQDQGRASGDPQRCARRRAHCANRRRRRLRRQVARLPGRARAQAGAQLQARVQARHVARARQLRLGDVHLRQIALDAQEHRRLVGSAQAR